MSEREIIATQKVFFFVMVEKALDPSAQIVSYVSGDTTGVLEKKKKSEHRKQNDSSTISR